MKQVVILGGFLAMCCTIGSGGPALAQTETQRLNHDVQRLWNDTFDPHRDRDRAAWERRREAERRDWCRDHHDFDRCRHYFR